MRHRLFYLFAASALAVSCSSLDKTVQYQQAASVTNRLNDHAFVLHHTPAGSYTYNSTSDSSGVVTLSVAGVTNKEDQDAMIQVLEGHRFDKDRTWTEILVNFYAKTVVNPQGYTYVQLLRETKIEP